MIFDSADIARLRDIYRDLLDFEVPEIVYLDRFTGYEGERQLIEELFSFVNPAKQKDWRGRLINIDAGQHVGAWFEIMLFGWIKKQFNVVVEPEICGNFPDFCLDIKGQQFAIEAKAVLNSPEERKKNCNFNRFFSALSNIEKPFIVHLEQIKSGCKPNITEFTEKINRWLETNSTQHLIYQDEAGNLLRLIAEPTPHSRKVMVFSSEDFRIDPEQLKSPLSEKASQHKALRNNGYPYIIAVFLEPHYLSAEEVVEAWLGKTTVIFDLDANQVVEEKIDQSGISFWSNEIKHRSVAGTLVFKAEYDKEIKSRYLQSWYVQNPYANVFVDPALFPTSSRFIVVGQDKECFEMKWIK